MQPRILVTSIALCASFAVFANVHAQDPQSIEQTSKASPEADPNAAIEKEIADILAGLTKQRDAVTNALAQAVKDGHLKSGNESTYQHGLRFLIPADGSLPDPDRSFTPGRSEPGLESLNLAWTVLGQEIQRANSRAADLSRRIAGDIGEALKKAVREAEKPEQLDPVDKLIARWGKIPTTARQASSATQARDTVRRVSAALRNGLDGVQKNDAEAVSAALAGVGEFQSGFRDSTQLLSFNPKALIDEFQLRIGAPFIKASVSAQQNVEQALIGGRSYQEVENAIAAFQEKQKIAERFRGLSRRDGYSGGERANHVEVFRAVAETAEIIKGPFTEEVRMISIPLPQEGQQPFSPEFRTFLQKLNAKCGEYREKAAEHMNAQRAEQLRKEREDAEQKARAAVAEQVKQYREKLAAIDTPESALAFANELSFGQQRDERGTWGALQAELRQIAAYWLDGVVPADPETERMYGSYGTHALLAETRAVRARAVRSVVAKRLNLPQLLQSPLGDKPVYDAIAQLSEEAAGRSDWKQCHDLVRVLASREGNAGGPATDRLQAIRAFLTGQNLEAAAQYAEAAESYLIVIRAVGDLIPTKEAGERLRKIQATHPGVSAQKNATSRDSKSVPRKVAK